MLSLVGIWKLVEARAFDEAGYEAPSPIGPEPMGVLLIEAERIMVTAGDGRVTLPRAGNGGARKPAHDEAYDRTSERLTQAEVPRTAFVFDLLLSVPRRSTGGGTAHARRR
jgi:hypothetical protein